MQVKLAVLADYANVTGDGKLNILGIFDRINLMQIPAVHTQMHLILRLEAHPAEQNRAHSVEIRLQDPEGVVIFEVQGEIVPRGEAGQTVSTNQILTLNNLQLEKIGDYRFIVLINGDVKTDIPLAVEFVAMAPPAGPPSAQFN
ncbi:MAG TPA: hypothetical protein VM100_02705 [Longimicrobiales bacterium]|nr:hypothetical protein [Longimicrobiales bacterium]